MGASLPAARVVAAPLAVSVVVVLPISLLGAMFVEIGPEFGLDQAALGTLAAVFLVVSIVAVPVAGRLTGRRGSSRGLLVATLLAGVACLGIATTAQSWLGLVPWLIAAGLANAIGQPATSVFVAATIPAARQGAMFGVKQSTVPLGTLLAGLAVPTVALTVGWRWSFGAAAVLAALAAVIVPTRHETPPLPPGADTAAPLRAWRSVLLLTVALAFGIAGASALGVFFVDAVVTAGFSPATAGWLQAAGSVAGVAARLLAGRVADAPGAAHLRLVSGMLLGGAAGYLLLAAGGDVPVVVGTFLAFGLGWGWVGVFFFAIIRLRPDAPGPASGVAQVGDFLGSLVGPVLFGSLAAGGTYRTAWLVAAVLAVIGAGAMLAGDRYARRSAVRSPSS